ncbi:MAG: penicillin-binding protein 1C [Alphaproteobacteria bacterium]|nr:penicillin-binding protein 1C [Alphaproteobacteria bacterium]
MRRCLIRVAIAGAACSAVLAVAGVYGAITLDRMYPPPMPDERALSAEVVDRDDALLRVFATPEGRWRLKADLQATDPAFLSLLIAYEDKRFWSHHGVDPLAIARSLWQFVLHRRVVSGGSTLTMQLARLLEPRPERTLGAKVLQMARALQLEQRLSKAEILQWYLTLAPYGGNLEGIRAASLAYFGKGADRLRLAEAALLVALPQSPERRRPDRFADIARSASLRVLERAVAGGLVEAGEVERVAGLDFEAERRAMPALAAHLAERARQKEPDALRHKTRLKRSIQAGLEDVARDAAKRLNGRVSIALVMADSRDGTILAQVGSPNYFDGRRAGWLDMSVARRSPGSTLKPFIYGLAFQEGLVAPETLISDRSADFGGYRPRNFDMTFQGDVSVRTALQMSLNVPAIRLLDGVGPAQLTALFRRSRVETALPAGGRAGLSIGLGGIGISLRDLVQLYTGLAAANGRPSMLTNGVDDAAGDGQQRRLLESVARWHVTDILRGIAEPAGSKSLDIAYKTGTSYGYRDAWSLGYDGRYVIGVWIGRADNTAVPGMTGQSAAAPVLFEAFSRSGLALTPFGRAPAGAVRLTRQDLPVAMRRYQTVEDALDGRGREAAPHIAYPPAGARVALSNGADGSLAPLVVKLQGGRPPFRWLANGKPLDKPFRRRQMHWVPDGPGNASLMVIDAAGRAASIDVFVE